jgi:hypothetical protein
LPSNLEELLDEHNVVERVTCPIGMVAPIQSIPIVPGVRCLVEGCNYATKTIGSALSNHVYRKHKGQGREVLEHCNVQWVYHTPSQYWAVEPNYSTFAGNAMEIANHLEAIKALDRRGLNTGHASAPVNQRLVTPFLSSFKWAEIIDGKDIAALRQLININKKNDDLPMLTEINHQYFDDIQPIMEGFNPIALQWINTPKG